jgi:hypothetical protein
MSTKTSEEKIKKISLNIELEYSDETMFELEDKIQNLLNTTGQDLTGEVLKNFDTNGDSIIVEGKKYTSKGLQREFYETLYGKIEVERHIYQGTSGGKTFCPMENQANMILNSSPKYARAISFLYAQTGGVAVAESLKEIAGRVACPTYMKKISDSIGEEALIHEQDFEYVLPVEMDDISSISIGLDGTCMLMAKDGWREAMAGTISLFNDVGERQYTIYIGATPEYGKATFLGRLDDEINKIKETFPHLIYIGVADGAPENWKFLKPRVDKCVLDYFHASEYVKLAAKSIYPSKKNDKKRKKWIKEELHKLKHNKGGAKRFLNLIISHQEKVYKKDVANLQKVITYFTNNYKKMIYAEQLKNDLSIGSGVTEAACKELIKGRMGRSGMRWGNKGAASVLATRSLTMTKGRWSTFWKKIMEIGTTNKKSIENIEEC